MYAAFALLSFLFVWRFVPETKGKTPGHGRARRSRRRVVVGAPDSITGMTDDDGAAAADPESTVAPTSMAAPTPGAPSFRKLLAPTAITLLLTGAILYGLSKWWGAPVLSAGYIGVMFLAPAIRVLSLRGMVYATAWASVILCAGCSSAGTGPGRSSAASSRRPSVRACSSSMVGRGLSRSPASFLGFNKFADSGGFSDLWQPLVGLLIAAVAVSVLGAIAFGSSRKHPMREPLSERIYYGSGWLSGVRR